MSFYPYTSSTSDSSAKHLEIETQRQELLEESMNLLVKRTKNPPSLKNISDKVEGYALIAATHEELVLRQMQKAADSRNSKKFWENQKRFLEFIDLENSVSLSENANLGYKRGHAWFLNNSMCFSMRFLNINQEQLKEYRRNNWRAYNELCREMNEKEMRYSPMCFNELILIPV